MHAVAVQVLLLSLWLSIATGASSGDGEFTLLQWNVLARQYTGHIGPAIHGAEEHQEGIVEVPSAYGDASAPSRRRKALEAENQTRARYAWASDEILRLAPDVACLQEVEPGFLEPEWNGGAGRLLEVYDFFGHLVANEGVPAVLVRKQDAGGRLEAPAHGNAVGSHPLRALHVPGSRETTGGISKSAVAVPVRLRTADAKPGRFERWRMGAPYDVFWTASAHLAFYAAPRVRLLRELQRQLDGELQLKETSRSASRLLLAGDFNTQPDALPELERETLLKHMRRVPFESSSRPSASDGSGAESWRATAAGGLPAVIPECIDFVYAPAQQGEAADGAGFSLYAASHAEVGGTPSLPYERVEGRVSRVVAASDHVWLRVRLRARWGMQASWGMEPEL